MENNIQNTETEVWRPIQGFEGSYEVSSEGRVRSLDRLVNRNGGVMLRRGEVLKQSKNHLGYLQVGLSKDGKQTQFKVHRLVASAFPEICGGYELGLEVEHKNCIRTDNRVENLRFCSHKENCGNKHSRKHYSDANKGDKNPWYGKFGKEHPGFGKIGKDNRKSIPIIQYDNEGKFLAEHEGLRDVERKLGINHGNLWSALNGRYKTAGGYVWKYKQ